MYGHSKSTARSCRYLPSSYFKLLSSFYPPHILGCVVPQVHKAFLPFSCGLFVTSSLTCLDLPSLTELHLTQVMPSVCYYVNQSHACLDLFSLAKPHLTQARQLYNVSKSHLLCVVSKIVLLVLQHSAFAELRLIPSHILCYLIVHLYDGFVPIVLLFISSLTPVSICSDLPNFT